MEAGAKKTGKKPVQLEMVGGKSNRQRIWEAIRVRRDTTFTKDELSCVSKVNAETVASYLQGLLAAGYVRVAVEAIAPHQPRQWAMAKDNGVRAPEVTRRGRPAVHAPRNQAMWGAMRHLPTFCVCDVVNTASRPDLPINHDTAETYIQVLARNGYLQQVQAARRMGAYTIAAVYRLKSSKNTGPRAPMICRSKAVYDPNIDQTIAPPARKEARHVDE